MKTISLDEFEKLSRRRHTVVAEGKEIDLPDGSKATPVTIRTKGFRPVTALVVVPKEEPEASNTPEAPKGWTEVEGGATAA